MINIYLAYVQYNNLPFNKCGLSLRGDLSHIKKGCGPWGLLAENAARAGASYRTRN